MRFSAFLALLIAAGLTACAGNPQPGDPGYRFNVSGRYAASFVVEGTPYTGTVDLSTAAGGDVTGSMAITSPVEMTSNATGSVVADTLRLTIPYQSPDGCGGTALLTGTIAEGGGTVGGAMDLDDSCGGPLTGSFTLTR